MDTELESICVVDDDDAVRDSMRMLLESYGLTVEDFPSARAFLARAGKPRCGCVLLDLHMPEMSGLELLDRMHSEGSNAPVIVITGRGDPVTMRHAKDAGAFAIFDKPVNDEALVRSIGDAMAASRH